MTQDGYDTMLVFVILAVMMVAGPVAYWLYCRACDLYDWWKRTRSQRAVERTLQRMSRDAYRRYHV